MLEERRSSQSPPTVKTKPSGAGTVGMVVSAGRSYDDDLIRELIFTFQGIEGTMLRGRYVKQIIRLRRRFIIHSVYVLKLLRLLLYLLISTSLQPTYFPSQKR